MHIETLWRIYLMDPYLFQLFYLYGLHYLKYLQERYILYILSKVFITSCMVLAMFDNIQYEIQFSCSSSNFIFQHNTWTKYIKYKLE